MPVRQQANQSLLRMVRDIVIENSDYSRRKFAVAFAGMRAH
jgi:hypothetical protein